MLSSFYSNANISQSIRATETYMVPNYWKCYKVFAEPFRFEIATMVTETRLTQTGVFLITPLYFPVLRRELDLLT